MNTLGLVLTLLAAVPVSAQRLGDARGALDAARAAAAAMPAPASKEAPVPVADVDDPAVILTQIEGHFKAGLAAANRDDYFESFGRAEYWTFRLLEKDPANGHGLYFRCEIFRKTKRVVESRDSCGKYLEIEKTLPDAVARTGTDVKLCYGANVQGYCQQRTAWISHLLANDFYAAALKSGNAEELKLAADLSAHALARYPGGFNADGALLATRDLKARADAALAVPRP